MLNRVDKTADGQKPGQKKLIRIGIFTITADANFGNRLQNYALQTVLERMSTAEVEIQAETVLNGYWLANNISHIPFSQRMMEEPGFRTFIDGILENPDMHKQLFFHIIRQQSYLQFNQEYIKFSPIAIQPSQDVHAAVKQIIERYDYFVAGSDQIWNFSWEQGNPIIDMLSFAAKEKCISYAASFGVAGLSQEAKRTIAPFLREIGSISVRENDGAEIVERIIGQRVPVLPDPVQLLSKEQWRSIGKKPVWFIAKREYILTYIFGRKFMPEVTARVEQLAEHEGLQVIHMLDEDALKSYRLGPAEFIYLLAHCQALVTNSFHGTTFALLFKKPFLTIAPKTAKGRIDTLLQRVNMMDRCITSAAEITTEYLMSIDFGDADQRMQEKNKEAVKFLQQAIPVGGPLKLHTVRLRKAADCTGCGACAAVCPQQCLVLRSDDDGFAYPQVDTACCIDCGACSRVCPNLAPMERNGTPRTFLCRAADDLLRRKSSSGGLFTLLAESVLAKNGVIFGAGFDKNFRVVHKAAVNRDELAELRQSKYVQSDMQGCFAQVRHLLQGGRLVLFSGTPCQTTALEKYVGQDRSLLICVDLVCHGVPSPLLWEKYLAWRLRFEGRSRQELDQVYFRDKTRGWRNSSLAFIYKDGRKTALSADPFQWAFSHNLAMRDACAFCRMKGRRRSADITLGDFWGMEEVYPALDDNQGGSLCLIHSLKGAQLFAELQRAGRLLYREVEIPEGFLLRHNPNLLRSEKLNPQSETFLTGLNKTEEIDFTEYMKAYKE